VRGFRSSRDQWSTSDIALPTAFSSVLLLVVASSVAFERAATLAHPRDGSEEGK
jgi:hypothetical protein